MNENLTTVYFQIMGDSEVRQKVRYFNYYYSIELCNFCLKNEELIKSLGGIHTVEGQWGRIDKVISIRDITEEGFDNLEDFCSPYLIDMLKNINSCETLEEAINAARAY